MNRFEQKAKAIDERMRGLVDDYQAIYKKADDEQRDPTTEERLEVLRKADRIVTEEVRAAGLYEQLWQSFAVLLPVRTVGVKGDARSYEHVCALRAVTSTDGMTAESFAFDHAFLAAVATRIVNEVRGINRVVYDVTSKPPGTIEWE
mgnify:CR=1 FL=1